MTGIETANRYGFSGRFLASTENKPKAGAIEISGTNLYFTYEDLLQVMEIWLGYLETLSVVSGEMVMILLEPGTEFMAGFYALVAKGAIALPMSYNLTPFEFKKIISDAQPVGIITSNWIYSKYQSIIGVQKHLRFVCIVDGLVSSEGNSQCPQVIAASSLPKIRRPIIEPSGNPVVTCHYTYKGLGYPLGVLHRYHDYTACLEAFEMSHPVEKEAVGLVSLPLYHIYGLFTLFIGPLSCGCKLVIVPSIMEQNLIDLLESHKISFTFLAPAILPELIAEAKARIREGKKINLNPNFEVGTGGSFLNSNLAREVVETLGVEPYQGYGMTEALLVTSNFMKKKKQGTLGTPIGNTIHVSVHDAFGRETAIGRAGEILIKSPSLSEGFLNRPLESKLFFQKGYFHTGDLGFLDKQKFLHFVGHSQPIAKIDAHMVDLVEVKSVLASHPAVAETHTTVGRPDHGREYITASVVLKKKAAVEAGDIQRFCRKYLSAYKVPRKIRIYHRRLV